MIANLTLSNAYVNSYLFDFMALYPLIETFSISSDDFYGFNFLELCK